jgi:hypothetical protein
MVFSTAGVGVCVSRELLILSSRVCVSVSCIWPLDPIAPRKCLLCLQCSLSAGAHVCRSFVHVAAFPATYVSRMDVTSMTTLCTPSHAPLISSHCRQMANIEFANAAQMRLLSMKHWDLVRPAQHTLC